MIIFTLSPPTLIISFSPNSIGFCPFVVTLLGSLFFFPLKSAVFGKLEVILYLVPGADFVYLFPLAPVSKIKRFSLIY